MFEIKTTLQFEKAAGWFFLCFWILVQIVMGKYGSR